ncbi:MAG: DUF6261 family protein [Capnocytophaga sp.]|nr:DUF6261 family protein [Capnocytophaga sp.]
MNKINYKIRVSEAADVSSRLVSLFAAEVNLQKDSFLKNLFDKIEEQTEAISMAIKKETAVSKLEEADNLRDETIFNLNNILVGYRSMRSVEIKESAEKVYAVFQRYGTRLTRENYSSASAHIDSLLRDLAVPEIDAAVEKLAGVEETIEELRVRQNAFHNERMAYEKALSVQETIATATSIKKPLLDLINGKLVTFLTAMEGEARYENLTKVITQVIDSANEIISRRNKKSEK